MYKFGTVEPRALDSFGIAGVLGEEAYVFYTQLFSTKHIGRVSDLLSARLKFAGVDPLQLRMTLAFSILTPLRRGMVGEEAENEFSKQPMMVEYGIDREKTALGISFYLPETFTLHMDRFVERIHTKQPKDSFEEMVIELYQYADQMVMRYHIDSRRIEFVLLSGVRGKISEEYLKEKKPPIVVVLDDQSTRKTPKPRSYSDLGDLDYPNLLQDQSRSKLSQNLYELKVVGRHLKQEFAHALGREDQIEVEAVVFQEGSSEPVISKDILPAADSDVHGISGISKILVQLKALSGWFGESEKSDDIEQTGESPNKERLNVTEFDDFEQQEGAASDAEQAEIYTEIKQLIHEIESGRFTESLKQMSNEISAVKADVQNPKMIESLNQAFEKLKVERAALIRQSKMVRDSFKKRERQFRDAMEDVRDELIRLQSQLSQKIELVQEAKRESDELLQEVERLRAQLHPPKS